MHLARGRAGLVQRGHKGRVLTAVTAPAGRTALPIAAPRAMNEGWVLSIPNREETQRQASTPRCVAVKLLSQLEAASLPDC
jgi:hypothetical protein